MPSLYQPRRGGLIEVVEEQAASDISVDVAKRPDSTEAVHHNEKFISDYIQQNSKRIQSASSSLATGSSSLSYNGDVTEQQETIKNQRRSARRASARRLFEVNEWDEEQKRLKQKLQSGESNTNCSYNEIKATAKKLLEDSDQVINKYDFETNRRREIIYRNYRSNVREPFLLAKFKQFERLDKTRSNRNRFKTQQYNRFLEFINKHQFITQDDYDKDEYDAMAQYEDKTDEIHTRFLPDPTLLPYRKSINERRTLSSLGSRSEIQKIDDPSRGISEQDFRYYHRTTTPLYDSRDSQSTHSWQLHDQTVVDSRVRRLASAKCYHIAQQSQHSITCDPIDPSLSYLRPRSSSSTTFSTRNSTPA